MCSVRGWGRRTRLSCYLCYSAVHGGDGWREDPLLQGLLHGAAGDLLGRRGRQGPDGGAQLRELLLEQLSVREEINTESKLASMAPCVLQK